MLKNKQLCPILFLGLFAIGSLAVPGQSQTSTTARATSHGVQRRAGSMVKQSYHNRRSQSVQQSAATNLTFGLIDFPRSTASNAFGINSKGDIVGGYGPMPPAGYFETTGYWLKGNTYRTLAYPGAAYSAPLGLNDKRVIIGFYDLLGDQNFRGYQYKGAEFTTIDYPGAPSTGPLAINNSGEVIGIYVDSSGIQHGFTLKDGVYATIDVPNSYDTEPLGINSTGVIVGDYYDSDNIQHGFVYQNNQFTSVDYPGVTNTVLSGINDVGDIIGHYGDDVIVAGFEWGTSNIFLLDQGTFTPLALPLGDIQVMWSYTMNGDEFVGLYVDSIGNLFGYQAQIPSGAVNQNHE